MNAGTPLRVDPATELFRKDFVAHAADLPGAGLDWLSARRTAAIDAFSSAGMPTRRMEAWKYTDLANALEAELEPATPTASANVGSFGDPFAGLNAARIVLTGGHWHRTGATVLPDGIEIVDLAQLSAATPAWVEAHLGKDAAAADQPLGAASLALMRGGVAIRVRAGVSVRTPLHLQMINPARSHRTMAHTRMLLILEDGASLTLLESHAGEGGNQMLANLGIELVLAQNAKLTHISLQAEAPDSLHVTSIGASLGRDAQYRALFAHLGARMARVDMNVRLAAPGADAAIRSITVLDGEAHADMTTVMDHASPHTKSRQLFKSVLGGRARSVSQGRVTVREGAVKSDSHQLFKALLLGPRAEADAKPELEIYADDVICGHGTAIGALDANALFYLRARGIPEEEARGLLVRAFLEDALHDFAEPPIHDVLWKAIDTALAGVNGGAA